MKTYTTTQKFNSYRFDELDEKVQDKLVQQEIYWIDEYFYDGVVKEVERKIEERLRKLAIVQDDRRYGGDTEVDVEIDSRHGWSYLTIDVSGKLKTHWHVGTTSFAEVRYKEDVLAAWKQLIEEHYKGNKVEAVESIDRLLDLMADNDNGFLYVDVRATSQDWSWSQRSTNPVATVELLTDEHLRIHREALNKAEHVIYETLCNWLEREEEALVWDYDADCREAEGRCYGDDWTDYEYDEDGNRVDYADDPNYTEVTDGEAVHVRAV